MRQPPAERDEPAREVVHSVPIRIDWVARSQRHRHETHCPQDAAAATATAALSVAGFTIIAAAQSDEQPTHAELVQRWAEAGIDAQLRA
jgi:hypothetical protein